MSHSISNIGCSVQVKGEHANPCLISSKQVSDSPVYGLINGKAFLSSMGSSYADKTMAISTLD